MKRKKPFRPASKGRYEIDHSVFVVGYHVFCDGCCEPNPGPGGWGVAVHRDGVEIASDHGGDPAATNNRMELTSLLKGIGHAKALKAPVTVWCDSQYAVKGTNEWRHGWKKNGWQRAGAKAEPKNRILLNSELWQAIDAAMVGVDHVRVKWCKGHAGIIGNERADALSSLGVAGVRASNDGSSFDRISGDYLTNEYRRIMAE